MLNSVAKLGAACGAALVLSGSVKEAALHSKCHVNFTDSLPRGVYCETQQPITKGALVAACLPAELATFGAQRGWLMAGSCPTGIAPILKHVIATAGDTVELTDKYVAVNGQILLNSRTLFLDSQGRSIPHVPRGTFTLSEGEVFLFSDHIPNSWDSRYTGPARVADVIATVRPVWVEG